jgi:opacity protein-like surface antigen
MTSPGMACLVAVLLVSASTAADAQDSSETSRLSVAYALGATIGGQASRAIVGGSGELRIAKAVSVVVDAGRAWGLGTDDLDARANRLAAAVGLGSGAAYDVVHASVGIRLRAPSAGQIEPYADVGLGAARVRTQTTFWRSDGTTVAPSTRGIELGPDLQGSTTKRMVTTGAGATISLARHIFGDLGAGYSRILSKTSEISNDRPIDLVRMHAGIGIRF